MRKLILLIALVALFASTSAIAKELTFFFDVHSSSAEIYPCDAGIQQGSQKSWCHYKGSITKCEPSQVGQTTGQTGVAPAKTLDGLNLNKKDPAHACICTGGSGGSYLMNFMRFKAATWERVQAGDEFDPNHMGWSNPSTKIAYSTKNGTTVAREMHGKELSAKNVPQEFKTQLEAVTFNFSSELYGAHFFVDLCYRGPQIPFYIGSENDINARARFTTNAWITKSNPFTTGSGGARTLDYYRLAGLEGKWKMVCDRQGDGKYKYDHNGTGRYNAGNGEFDTFVTDIKDTEKSPWKGSKNFLAAPMSTSWVGILKGDLAFGGKLGFENDKENLLNNQVITRNYKTPRFCKFRYYFAEKIGGRERAWQRHDARFVVKWKVEEPVDTDVE